jgi:phosphoserine aminotransferase
VLKPTQQAILEMPKVGLSVLGIRRRSDGFAAVLAESENNVRALLGLTHDYRMLLPGGATPA